MTIGHIIHLLLERRRFIAVCAALGLLAGLIWALVAQPLYQGTTQLVLNVRAPETIGTQSVADQLSADYLLTQEDIIRSRRVALQVVSRLGPATVSELASIFGWTIKDGPREDFVANKLRGSLRIEDSAVNSRVISLAYVSPDRDSAANLANAFADAYIDVSIDLQAEPAQRAAKLYDAEMATVQRRLSVAQQRLGRKSKELGITSGHNEPDAESVRLEALSSQLASAEAAHASSGSRTIGSSLPETLTNPVIQGLQSELAQLEARRQSLATIAGPNNLDMQAVVGQIAALRRELRSQQALIRQGTSASSAQSSSTVARLAEDVEQARARVIASRASKSELAVLEQDVKNAQALYDQMAARKSQLDILGEGGQTNISLLAKAAQGSAIWPRPKLLMGGGMLIGTLLSVLAVIALELMDRRIRHRSELESWLGIPDLGHIRNSGQFSLETPANRPLLSRPLRPKAKALT